MKCKKSNGERWSCDQNPLARRKIENNKKKYSNSSDKSIVDVSRTEPTTKELKKKHTLLWIWLISQSYSFSSEAQMLHLWITIKRNVLNARTAGTTSERQSQSSVLKYFPFVRIAQWQGACVDGIEDETHPVALLFRINFQSTRHGDHFN